LIGVLSGKGGVGKTTVVTNLSTALSMEFEKKVTIIDCNVTTSHLGMHFGIYFHPITLNRVLKGEATIEDAIFNHSSGVQIIPASLNLSDLIGVDITVLDKKIKNLFEYEDFIFLDIAPGFGKEAVSAMKVCKEALVVSTPDIPSVTDVVRLKGVMDELKINPLGLVLNKVTGEKYELREKEITQLTGLPILSKIPYEKKIMESLAVKTPLVMHDSKTRASIEFFKLASVISGEEYEPPAVTFLEKLGRIFRRLS